MGAGPDGLGAGLYTPPPLDLVGGSFGDFTVLTALGDRRTLLVQRAAEAGFARLLVVRVLFADDDPRRHQLLAAADETRRAAHLQHPNLRHVSEIGCAEGSHYVAVEYLEGVGLDQILRARGRDPRLADPRLHCALLAQACEGLHQAHRVEGLVHGHLRPESVLVSSGGTVKLLGLGMRALEAALASAEDLADPERYAYLAPEQILERPPTPRSDVFSVGVIAWEALTGKRLFSRRTRVEAMRAITEASIPRPSATASGLPAALDQVIERALARDPEQRYATTRELAAALEEGVAALGAPHSTVAIAAGIESWFSAEIEAQRSLVLRARRELEAIADGSAEDDFDVPTRLFNEDEDDRALAAQLGLAPPSPAPGPLPALPGASTGPRFARPPDTLSEGTQPAGAAPGPEPPPSVELPPIEPPARSRLLPWLLLTILALAAGTAGYLYWEDYLETGRD
jgi:eukaryotic-like serine/threonine-protein kinase